MAKVTVQVAKKVTHKKAVTKKAPAKKAVKRAKKTTKRVSKDAATRKVSSPSKRTARAKKTLSSSSTSAERVAIGGSGAKYALNGLPWVLAVGLGSLLFFKSREGAGAGAPAPVAPIPGLESAPTPTPAPAPAPKPAPDLSAQERVDLDFRRAKTSEIPRDILQKAKRHINEPIGAIIFETSTVNGKEYAFVLEQHSNLKLGDGGVSVFIHR